MLEIVKTDNGYRLTAEIEAPRPLDEVFAFFADAHNLEELTPPWLNFSVLTPAPIAMGEGTLIDYKLRLRGIPLRWQSRIAAWNPPHQFVDEQTRGPYRRWHHEHTFEATDRGTLIRDVVDYAVPGGALVHWLLVGRDVRNIFQYRTERMAELFK